MTGDEYKALRLQLGLTQADLADALGVDRLTVTRRESGRRAIPSEGARLLRLMAVWPSLLEGLWPLSD